MNKRKILRIFIIILIVFWMRIVFGFSAQGSTESSNLSLMVASWFTKDIEVQEFLEPYIRKIAHFSEYGIGGALFFSFFATFKIKDEKRILLSSLIGLLYASTDEVHQLFVDGRSGQIKDVYIDTLGVITGALSMCLLITLSEKLLKNIIEKIRKIT